MTDSDIERVAFNAQAVSVWAELDERRKNWPVVYTLDGPKHIYVGETTQVATRIKQHLGSKDRQLLTQVRVIVNDTFNKSVCLDLESYLIRMFAGDGKYKVENSTAGIAESNYYQREDYRTRFNEIFEWLRKDGLFDQTALEIENSDLFKYSPFKSLTTDQTAAALEVLTSIFAGLRGNAKTMSVVQGPPGTGKTIVAIYILKVLADIQAGVMPNNPDSDSVFADLYTSENTKLLEGFRAALVIPQQSLRKTIEKVFRKTPRLNAKMVLTPFAVGNSDEQFDLVIVDEAHRLQQLASTMPTTIKNFKKINTRRYGSEKGGDQVDWIRDSSRHSIFMLDIGQSVRPADIPAGRVRELTSEAESNSKLFPLRTQMRVQAGEDYTGYVRKILNGDLCEPIQFAEYDLRFFDDIEEMRTEILSREDEVGLSRLVAGFAWPWVSKNDASAFDISIDGVDLRWNRTATDWINSPTSIDEIGSIHTVQGYDLNYAGVIIGPDLRYEKRLGRLFIERDSYFDAKGKSNNKMLGITYSDDDLLRYIANVYSVLLTRGIRGTYVYVCDKDLRDHLRPFFSGSHGDTLSGKNDVMWAQEERLRVESDELTNQAQQFV